MKGEGQTRHPFYTQGNGHCESSNTARPSRAGTSKAYIQQRINYNSNCILPFNSRYSAVLNLCVFFWLPINSNSIPPVPNKLIHQKCCQMPHQHLWKITAKTKNCLLRTHSFIRYRTVYLHNTPCGENPGMLEPVNSWFHTSWY